jgi:hypothetical protein
VSEIPCSDFEGIGWKRLEFARESVGWIAITRLELQYFPVFSR